MRHHFSTRCHCFAHQKQTGSLHGLWLDETSVWTIQNRPVTFLHLHHSQMSTAWGFLLDTPRFCHDLSLLIAPASLSLNDADWSGHISTVWKRFRLEVITTDLLAFSLGILLRNLAALQASLQLPRLWDWLRRNVAMNKCRKRWFLNNHISLPHGVFRRSTIALWFRNKQTNTHPFHCEKPYRELLYDCMKGGLLF